MKPILKYFKKTTSMLLALTVAAMILPIGVAAADSVTTYYVSPTGSDNADGSAENPYKTLNRAVQAMNDGDECIILPGTYRETLNINGKNNLKFKAQTQGTVTISGADEITGWNKYAENIWVADMTWDAIVYTGARNLVFQNGELRHEARWPNISADYSNPDDDAHPLLQSSTYARVDSGEKATPTITDAALSELSGKNLVGAKVWVASGVAFWSYISEVLSQDANTLSLTNTFTSGASYYPTTNNIYYIYGSMDLLDCQGEWYKDRTGKKLYFYSTTEPSGVEARRREHTIKVTNSTGIVLDGINARGGLVEVGANTSGCTIKNATMETLDINIPMATQGALGVVIAGENNLLTGSTIRNMYGEGVTVKGLRNRVINNYIHDINFEHTYSDGVYIEGSEHLVSHNTITHTGRSTIGGRFKACVISYNDLSDASRLSWDSGALYFNACDYDGTEIHHNILRDSVNNEVNQDGLYFDSFTTGMVVYKNLLYNLETGENVSWRRSMALNPNSFGNLFFNNTIVNTNGIGGMSSGDRSQTVFANNLFKTTSWLNETWIDIEELNNVASADCWNDATAGDYTLKSTASAAIDKGIKIPGVTDDVTDGAPDCGAFEYGGTDWTLLAGHDFANSSYQNEQFALNQRIPYRNLLKNQGFENATEVEGATVFSSWESINAPERIKNDSWKFYGEIAKDGEYALHMDDGDGVSQTITGLQSNTTYEIGAYAHLGHYVRANDGIDTGNMTEGLNAGDVVSGFNSTSAYVAYNIDFNANYDSMMFLLKLPSKINRTVKVRLGDPTEGEVIAEMNLTSADNPDAVSGWIWKSANLTRTLSGTQKCYICFEGDFTGVEYGGFSFDDSDGSDKITIRAVNAAGEMMEKVFTGRKTAHSVEPLKVTTNTIGTLTITIQKSNGILEGYADQIRLRQAFSSSGTIESASFVLDNFEVTYSDDEPAYSIHKGEIHKINGAVTNRLTGTETVNITFSGFDGEGNENLPVASTELTLAAGETKNFSLEAAAPLKDGAYFRLSLTDDKGESTNYLISDSVLENLYPAGESLVFVKDFSVRNSSGDLIASPLGGTFNMFGVTLRNVGDDVVYMNGILGIYVDGMLEDVMHIDRKIEADADDWFYLGTVLPAGENITARLFGWETLENLKPIFKMGLFE